MLHRFFHLSHEQVHVWSNIILLILVLLVWLVVLGAPVI
ncbi:hypothetical protein NIES2135_52890 [Leptolyngbya boryana NIES-2135]|uniref:Uncharacterized protein n=1 Tax=Leptolyngbya boryana NIES-2135 TaxID=1973484 RepID=A0A1Z4JNX7_LEPBY|nr:hypothetical protein NIES2135_52890 [Leptolyngbya boryana NIES-2135]